MGAWHNPLARRADRWQAGSTVLLITVWVLALPLAVALGFMVANDGVQAAETQAQDRTMVTATLLADARAASVSSRGMPDLTVTVVPAEWTTPDGQQRSGPIEVVPGLHAGDQVNAWIDPAGTPVNPPISAADAIVAGAVIATGTWFALGLVLALVGQLIVMTLDRGRLDGWEREWAAVEPVWTGRH